ncbi:MAG: hypothetical protein WB564_05630 [Dehalococcoidia bacterium]
MRSRDNAGLINTRTHALFGWQASGQLINKVLSFIHDDNSLAFWVHMYREPTPTRGTGYWQRQSERDTIDIASRGSDHEYTRMMWRLIASRIRRKAEQARTEEAQQ